MVEIGAEGGIGAGVFVAMPASGVGGVLAGRQPETAPATMTTQQSAKKLVFMRRDGLVQVFSIFNNSSAGRVPVDGSILNSSVSVPRPFWFRHSAHRNTLIGSSSASTQVFRARERTGFQVECHCRLQSRWSPLGVAFFLHLRSIRSTAVTNPYRGESLFAFKKFWLERRLLIVKWLSR